MGFVFSLSSYFQRFVIDNYNPVSVSITFSIRLESDLYIGMNVNSEIDIHLQRHREETYIRTRSTILDILVMIAVTISSLLIINSFRVAYKLAKV